MRVSFAAAAGLRRAQPVAELTHGQYLGGTKGDTDRPLTGPAGEGGRRAAYSWSVAL
ncbi:hypothetical protein KCH_30500 [Kitasatospora cheerisanensis KCTC 2395]|uniref:Uncharacterized protein n=1 Tax=Kitasatospora cheerisanensis KCTC 2395 TaxID=1348663 RepID=A0A066Z4I3_9ACTN|nr:hypothetical protein KCH_30500 [Kitasatospora cheerisanensis KCTC 2395]